MNQKNEQGLKYIVQAINNIVDPKVETLKYDKTYRAKVTTVVDTGVYKVEIAGDEYQLSYSGTLNVGDIVRVKAPLNNFSDIYIEAEPGTGGGGTGTSDYTKLTNKPVLNTTATSAQATSASQIITGTITLHKVSKTGSYNDLNDKPNLNFVPNTQKGVANGVATLNANAIVPTTQLPTDTVYDSNYTHIDVINNLTSTSIVDALSAAQGKALSDRVDANDTMIDTLQQDIIQTDDDVTKIKADYIPKGEKAAANGVATLDENTKIYPIQLPVATVDTLGAIKIGENLTITTDGVLSAVVSTPITVIDNLDSTSVTDALSANQGNVLNEKITVNTNSISDLQEDLVKTDDNVSAIQNDYISKTEKGTANGVATLDENVKISVSQLPIASSTTLGVIKVGENLTIADDGTLSSTGGGSGGVGGDTLPIGSVVEWYSATIPTNWFACNGQAVSRTDYAELFSVLGTTYGEGDGSTTFNLPDMSSRVGVGLDINDTNFDTLGKTGGEITHTLTIDEIPGHTHVEYAIEDQGAIALEEETTVSYKIDATGTSTTSQGANTGSTGGNGSHNNLQPYIVVNYIIKAKQLTAVPTSIIDNLTSDSTTDALSANQGRILNDKIQDINKVAVSNTEPTDNSVVLWIDTSDIATT